MIPILAGTCALLIQAATATAPCPPGANGTPAVPGAPATGLPALHSGSSPSAPLR